MKKSTPPLPFNRTAQKILLAILSAILFTVIAWTTHTVTQVSHPDPGKAIEIYASETNDDLRSLYLSAINSAQESILLLVYTLTDESIIHALRQKATAGINVRVIVDAKASPRAADKLGNSVHTLRRLGHGIMHSKILVVDGKLIWLGSANMTGDSLRLHNNLVLGLYSPAMGTFITAKANSLTESGKVLPAPHQVYTIGGQQVELWFLPDDAPQAVTRIKNLIREAKKTIRIAMFTWTRKDFAHEVVRAAKRGVDVEVVLDRNSGKGASSSIVAMLEQNDIRVFLKESIGLLHHKFMVIDGETLVNGSANWTKAAFGANDDCFLILDDLTDAQKNKLEEEWKIIRQEAGLAGFH